MWMLSWRSLWDILKSMPLSDDEKPKTKHSIRTRAHTHTIAFQEIVFVLLNRHICHLCCSLPLPQHQIAPQCLSRMQSTNNVLPTLRMKLHIAIAIAMARCLRSTVSLATSVWLSFCHFVTSKTGNVLPDWHRSNALEFSFVAHAQLTAAVAAAAEKACVV